MAQFAGQRGLMIAAPASGCGKTTATLGLLRALRDAGHEVAAAKSGPDYIDPQFHQAACGRPSVNLDGWAMRPERLRQLAARQGGACLLIEGAMGLFDGAIDGPGSAADVAAALGVPVVLVMDVRRQGQTAAVLAQGLARHRADVAIAGVILNRVGSARHERSLRMAFAELGIDVLGCLPSCAEIALPSRHLGLVQAGEIDGLEQRLGELATLVAAHVDLAALTRAAGPLNPPTAAEWYLPPPGRQVAIARDAAFAFAYPHMLEDWRQAGASLHPFSPLADEPPAEGCDAIFLPGGYPELHAARLASASAFHAGMRQAAARDVAIYGECGGFMVLGDELIDAAGVRHAMLGLLPLTTSFEQPRRQLGYRWLQRHDGTRWRGHEFHYATIVRQGTAAPLFKARASGEPGACAAGLRRGTVSGSFMHVIESDEPA